MEKVSKVHTNNLQLKPTPRQVPEEYRKFAQEQEAQFIKLMLEEMNKTVNKENPENQESQFYKSMLTDQYAQLISKQNGGIGLQQMILRQMLNERQGPAANVQQIEKYAKEASHE